MILIDEFFESEIKNKRVLDLGFAGFEDNEWILNRRKLLDNLSSGWFGCDINIKRIKAMNDPDRFFHCDLNKQEFMKKIPNELDLIMMFEVLEHLESPFRTIKYIVENKAKDTKILITTPNGMSMGRVLFGIFKPHRLLAQDIQHYYVFTKQALTNIAKDSGLVEFEIIPYVQTKKRYNFLKYFPHFASGFCIYGK